MHHPGPPRFVSTGETLTLAPRNPDPAADYAWAIDSAPDGSEATVTEEPIIEFTPDIDGVYRLLLTAPDGSHLVTVRAFPDNRSPVSIELPTDKRPLSSADINRILMDLDADADLRNYTTFGGPGRPRICLGGEVTDDSVEITADVHTAPGSSYGDDDLDVEFYIDDRDSFDGQLSIVDHRATIPVDEIDGVVRIHAVSVGERHSTADVLRLESRDGSVTIERPNDPPEWAKGAVVYEICPRTFAGDSGSDDYTTTFADLEDRIPYLEWLGIDCVWLMPVLGTRSSSGYQVTDYFDVASDLGTREEYESFVNRCHERGIKVLFDLVINHSGFDHPLFQLSAAGVDKYRDWYIWDENGEYEYYFDWTHLPNFNYQNLAVREYLLSIVDEWAEVVDGFRCDVAFGTPHGFWKEIREQVKEINPEFLLLDETLPRDVAYHESEFDAHHDTALYHALCDVGEGIKSASSLLAAAKAHEAEGFHDSSLQFRYVENHDMPRYEGEYGKPALRAATAMILMLPGLPMIYYGQERGVTRSGWPQAPMRWHDGDNEMTQFHRRLVDARSSNPVLRFGTLEDVDWDADTDRAVAFAREYDGERVVVAINFDETVATVVVNECLEMTDQITETEIDSVPDGESVRVSVEDVIVLRSKKR